MSAIFGEILRFGQPDRPDIQLIVTGDEFHSRHETLDGYTAVYDSDRRLYCYAVLVNGTFGQPGTVRQLKVSVDITHTYIGDLRLELVSPAGRSVVLQSQLGGSQDNLVVSYDSATPLSPLSSLVGQSMQGTWTLRVADLAAVDVGKLNKWSLELSPAS